MCLPAPGQKLHTDQSVVGEVRECRPQGPRPWLSPPHCLGLGWACRHNGPRPAGCRKNGRPAMGAWALGSHQLCGADKAPSHWAWVGAAAAAAAAAKDAINLFWHMKSQPWKGKGERSPLCCLPPASGAPRPSTHTHTHGGATQRLLQGARMKLWAGGDTSGQGPASSRLGMTGRPFRRLRTNPYSTFFQTDKMNRAKQL